jgi:hypothetical protein
MKIKSITKKHLGLMHTILGNNDTQYRLRAETGRCKGRVHYLPIGVVERFFAPCK